jgi:hypothetical protein
MIHEHEALELASAAIDFPLASDVERELQHELADCPVCAERASAYHEQLRMMARLPVVNASDATRQRVTAAAMAGRADTRSPMFMLLAAALLIGLLAALTAAAGALLTRQDQDQLTQVEASASPEAVVVNAPSESAPPLNGGRTGDGVFADRIPPDSIVEVVSTNLRVRSEPRVSKDSALLEPFLQPGDRLFVVEGPVFADDYDWYRVAPVGTDSDRPWHELPSGWVSRGHHDGTPWIAVASPDCPPRPVDIASLNTMHPLERVACFHDERLAFAAVVEGGSQDGWIALDRVDARLAATDRGIEVTIEPSEFVGAVGLPNDRAVVLEGAFDQCASSTEQELADRLACRGVFAVSQVQADSIDLQQGDFAITVTDDLRVRSLPTVATESKQFELIDNGTRLAVIDGPAVGSGYVWYKVVVPAIRTGVAGPRVGWVAAHGKDGEPWIGAEEFDCPAPADLTFEDFAFLATPPVFHGGIGCYGREPTRTPPDLSVVAHVRLECAEGVSPASWLQVPAWTLVLSDARLEVRTVTDSAPDAIPCGGPPNAAMYQVSGHFDDDRARDCRSADAPVGDPDRVAVYECRSRFVVTDLSPGGSGRGPVAP